MSNQHAILGAAILKVYTESVMRKRLDMDKLVKITVILTFIMSAISLYFILQLSKAQVQFNETEAGMSLGGDFGYN